MIFFKTKDQCIITPTIGIVKDNNGYYFNISWLMYGVVFKLIEITYNTEEKMIETIKWSKEEIELLKKSIAKCNGDENLGIEDFRSNNPFRSKNACKIKILRLKNRGLWNIDDYMAKKKNTIWDKMVIYLKGTIYYFKNK